MKVVWMILSLIIAVVIVYLIWEEFIAEKDDAEQNDWERAFGEDVQALTDEATPSGAVEVAGVAPLDASDAAGIDADVASEAAATAEEAVEEITEEMADEASSAASDSVEAVADVAAEEVVEVTESAAEEVTEQAVEAEAAVEDAAAAIERSADESTEALAAAVAEVASPDDMTKIKGIGKVYQQRLNDAGIVSFEQLIAADPEKLKEVTKAIDAANVEAWASQAQGLIEQRDS